MFQENEIMQCIKLLICRITIFDLTKRDYRESHLGWPLHNERERVSEWPIKVRPSVRIKNGCTKTTLANTQYESIFLVCTSFAVSLSLVTGGAARKKGAVSWTSKTSTTNSWETTLRVSNARLVHAF